ncbi:MAG: hypothetical protein AB1696_19345 [Planctomycetota bacterium]
MNRKQDDAGVLPELLDIKAIGERYMVKVVTVRKWRREGRFPKPDVRVGHRAFWTDATVAAWEERETWRKEEKSRPVWEESRRRMLGKWGIGREGEPSGR